MTTRNWVVRALLVASAGVVLCLGISRTSEARTARLRRLVVVGDSLLAGFSNGGLVVRGKMGQRDGAAALVARRAGVRLSQPMIDRPGFPPPLRIEDDNLNRSLDPGEVRRTPFPLGFRRDPDRVVRNLAVPGEDVRSVFDQIDADDVAARILSGNAAGREVMKFVILGLPVRSGEVSQVTRAQELAPTFLLVWLGSNDVLGMATHTNPAAHDLTAAEFGVAYRRVLDALAATGAGMAVANLADVTHVAALRPAAGEVASCRRADGTTQPVAPDDLLSIYLDRALLPVPPCGRVLDVAEQAMARDVVVRFNAEIAAAVAAVEQARGVSIALVDMFALLDQAAASGVDVRGDGSLVLTTDYLGGIFSLDGVHPTKAGHALLANAFIDAVNARFGEAIPRVDVARVASRDRLVGNRFRPAGEPPFGVVAGNEDTVESAFDEVKENLDDIADEVADIF